MRCAEFQNKVHEFMDLRLGARQMNDMDRHMAGCPACETLYRQFTLLRKSLAAKHTLPQASADALLLRIRRDHEKSLLDRARERIGDLAAAWRDIDWRFVWSKATAVPLTLCFFAAILMQFIPIRVEKMTAVLVSSQEMRPGQPAHHLLRSVEMRQDRSRFEVLIDTAWRLPYEDSLSLVVEITSDGSAEIGDVLEYPKSYALLDAVDSALKQSRFETGDLENPVLIYSFLKIDVYDDNLGL